MSLPTATEAAYSVLVSRLTLYVEYLNDNAAIDLAATQVIDEIDQILDDVEVARAFATRLVEELAEVEEDGCS